MKVIPQSLEKRSWCGGWTEAVAESPKSELVESGRWGQNPTGPKPGPSSKSLKVCKYLIYIGFFAEMREMFHECFTKDGWTDGTVRTRRRWALRVERRFDFIRWTEGAIGVWWRETRKNRINFGR